MKVLTDDGNIDIEAVWFEDGMVHMVDQRLLPHNLEVLEMDDHLQVADAIREMAVRGAPAIGATAAYGMALASLNGANLDEAAMDLKSTRPTAFDLFHAVDWMIEALLKGEDAVRSSRSYASMIVEKCRAIGRYGAPLIKNGSKVMTHCNAGALATVDVGTALAPMREAHDQGKEFFVFVSETRPRMQGMMLTAWELSNEGIDCAIISDGASGHFIRESVDLIIVGADRIAANGDFANKIGTFEKAVLADRFSVPFYVAAPVSTYDPSLSQGDDIIIEQRDGEEVTHIMGNRIAPIGIKALNPSFDVTPAELVDGFITELGVLKPDELHRLGGV